MFSPIGDLVVVTGWRPSRVVASRRSVLLLRVVTVLSRFGYLVVVTGLAARGRGLRPGVALE